MSELLNRRRHYQQHRPHEADKVARPVAPPAGIAPTSTIEKPADQLKNNRADVGAALVRITDADSTRRGIRFRNTGATTIYLGGSGVTADTAVVQLSAGDIWEESLAAAASWWAVSSAVGGKLAFEEVS